MAIKDWKQDKSILIPDEILGFWEKPQKNKDNLMLRIMKVEGKYEVEVREGLNIKERKYFKTKPLAFNYARKYMRKH